MILKKKDSVYVALGKYRGNWNPTSLFESPDLRIAQSVYDNTLLWFHLQNTLSQETAVWLDLPTSLRFLGYLCGLSIPLIGDLDKGMFTQHPQVIPEIVKVITCEAIAACIDEIINVTV